MEDEKQQSESSHHELSLIRRTRRVFETRAPLPTVSLLTVREEQVHRYFAFSCSSNEAACHRTHPRRGTSGGIKLPPTNAVRQCFLCARYSAAELSLLPQEFRQRATPGRVSRQHLLRLPARPTTSSREHSARTQGPRRNIYHFTIYIAPGLLIDRKSMPIGNARSGRLVPSRPSSRHLDSRIAPLFSKGNSPRAALADRCWR
jgi:hypothetical protein